MIEQLRPLTQEQRQAARQAARQAIVRSIGPRPVREQFAHHTIGKYPSSVTWLISWLCIILLLAAGIAIENAGKFEKRQLAVAVEFHTNYQVNF